MKRRAAMPARYDADRDRAEALVDAGKTNRNRGPVDPDLLLTVRELGRTDDAQLDTVRYYRPRGYR